jgi:hypothetical protein
MTSGRYSGCRVRSYWLPLRGHRVLAAIQPYPCLTDVRFRKCRSPPIEPSSVRPQRDAAQRSLRVRVGQGPRPRSHPGPRLPWSPLIRTDRFRRRRRAQQRQARARTAQHPKTLPMNDVPLLSCTPRQLVRPPANRSRTKPCPSPPRSVSRPPRSFNGACGTAKSSNITSGGRLCSAQPAAAVSRPSPCSRGNAVGAVLCQRGRSRRRGRPRGPASRDRRRPAAGS